MVGMTVSVAVAVEEAPKKVFPYQTIYTPTLLSRGVLFQVCQRALVSGIFFLRSVLRFRSRSNPYRP